jgi:hypothetical protein
MSTIERKPPAAPPPLVAGQRLRREEFHARYEAMPPGIKAELIGGVVFLMTSPVGRPHGTASVNVVSWLGLYHFRTPGVEAFDNASAVLDDEAEPQPDASLRISPECGGQSHDHGSFIGGAPELDVRFVIR